MRNVLRRGLPFLLCFLLFAPFHCRKADGVPADPLDREAEEALVAYLKIDTSNPPGNETAGAEFLRQLFAKEGIASELVGSDPKRQGIYARLRSGSKEKALLLLHHIDVVPAVPNEWTRPPFEGLRSGGYIWGRGALDIKSFGIANAMALVELKRRNAPLRRDVVFLGVPDEERGGLHGIADLLETRPELFEGVGYVLNEGGFNETIVDRISIWGIEVQQKVPLWLRLSTRGTAGHGSAPPADGGSLARLVKALGAIQAIETPYRLTPAVQRHFRAAGAVKTDARGQFLRTIAEPLDPERIESVLSPGYRVLLRDTIAITRISGGTSINSIPARAEAYVDIRLLDDQHAEPMLTRVREAAGGLAEVDVLLRGEPVRATPADTDLYRLLAQTMKAAEPRSAVIPVVGSGTTDSRFFRRRGVIAYGISPFKVNYYDVGTAHAPDERIRARFFVEGVRLMRRIVREFCAK